jgi:carbamoyltransferase
MKTQQPPSATRQQLAYMGLGGSRRNAAAALCVNGTVVAVCEQERVTRVRRSGIDAGRLPVEAMEVVLRAAGLNSSDLAGVAVAEAIEAPGFEIERFRHHFGHAATAFWTSPFDSALVLVCDRSPEHPVTLWRGSSNGIEQDSLRWSGPGFAELYSRATEAFGFVPEADEHRLEALARVGSAACADAVEPLVNYANGTLSIDPEFTARITQWVGTSSTPAPLARRAEIACGIQQQLANALLAFLRDVRDRTGESKICLGGGLFYNSFFTTAIAESGLFEETFVPVNPGNAGTAVGAAIAAFGAPASRSVLSPFLGPEYDATEIKAVLDNCKLSYDYVDDGELIRTAATALARGQLVGWFQGRMEWGARALGNRSILANPLSPYTLENLNTFLKGREPYQTYSLSVCEEDTSRFFDGPLRSEFMEFEYRTVRPELFAALMPLKSRRLRVQTVGAQQRLFRLLLQAFGAHCGTPVLVNTSFNGFHEPIVCTPRDAVRVFYGTGLDLAIIGNFVLRK